MSGIVDQVVKLRQSESRRSMNLPPLGIECPADFMQSLGQAWDAGSLGIHRMAYSGIRFAALIHT